MMHDIGTGFRNRRDFLRNVGVAGGAVVLGGCSGATSEPAMEAAAPVNWAQQVGLQLYTVRDQMDQDFEGTLKKVADIGYREVEPVDYGSLSPAEFRALLDSLGLRAPSTHGSATGGPGLEAELEGHQTMGFEYTRIFPQPGVDDGQPATEAVMRRRAAQLNEYGRTAQKFGMKVLVHNHDQEFNPLEGSSLTTYDVLLAETDPELVAFELDIGWAVFAGQDPIAMFEENPGRFELWHVKDFSGTVPSEGDRDERPDFTFVGHGDIDYPTIFTHAETAGLKHYYVEQDNAPDSGDSVDQAAASYISIVNLL